MAPRIKPTSWLCVLFLMLCALQAQAQGKDMKAAERHFEAGVKLLDDPDGARYAEAYSAFKAAYAASGSATVLGNLGLCAMKLERDGEALDAYRRYLTEAKRISRAERKQIQDDIGLLEARIATLVVSNLSPGMTLIDERIPASGARIVNRYGPMEQAATSLRVRAGRRRVSVEADGEELWSVELEVKAGERTEQTYAPAQSSTPNEDGAATESFPLLPIILTGATGVFAVITGISGGLALSKQSEFERINDGTDPSAANEARDEGVTLNVVTDVFLVTTLVTAGVSAAFWVMWAVEDSADGDDTETGVRVVPWLGPGLAGVAGRF